MNHVICVEVFDLLLTGVILQKLLVTGLKAPASRPKSSTQQSFAQLGAAEP